MFLVYSSCFFLCVCTCVWMQCLSVFMPACLCAFSLKVTFVCSVCFSFVYQHILCLRAGKQQYAKALSCLISLSARLFHHPTHYRPAQRDGPWLQHSEKLRGVVTSKHFFLCTSCLVNVQPLEAHFARLLSMMHKGSCHSLQILMFSIQEVVTLGKKALVFINRPDSDFFGCMSLWKTKYTFAPYLLWK